MDEKYIVHFHCFDKVQHFFIFGLIFSTRRHSLRENREEECEQAIHETQQLVHFSRSVRTFPIAIKKLRPSFTWSMKSWCKTSTTTINLCGANKRYDVIMHRPPLQVYSPTIPLLIGKLIC